MLNYRATFSSYSVDDLTTAKAFYGTTMGLAVKETKEGLDLQLNGGNSVFLYAKSNHVPATFTVLNFAVANIDAAVEELTKAGVQFEHYAEGMIKTDEKGIARGRAAGMGPDIAWFKDPAGNFLSVLQE